MQCYVKLPDGSVAEAYKFVTGYDIMTSTTDYLVKHKVYDSIWFLVIKSIDLKDFGAIRLVFIKPNNK